MTPKAPTPFAGLLNRRLLGELAATFEETLAALKSYVQSSIEINASLGEEHKTGRKTEKEREKHREGEEYNTYVALFKAYFVEKTIRKDIYIPAFPFHILNEVINNFNACNSLFFNLLSRQEEWPNS